MTSDQLKTISRREALARWPDVVVCDDPANCLKKYPPKPTRGQHKAGFVDNWNVIHLADLGKRVRAQGMYELCVLMGRRQPEIARLPEHHKIWKSHTWATEEMKRKFHRLARIEWSIDERIRAWKIAERAGVFMHDDISFYWWCYQGRRRAIRAGRKEARSQNRGYLSDGLLAAWAADRAAGMSFHKIGAKYNRDYRIVWKALVRHGLHEVNAT